MISSYNPSEIESKWQKIWEESPYYKAENDFTKRKFYILTEFPYPSGEGLHIGHAFNYSIPDICARKKRMEGYNVLFPTGWDAFGLPTENYAIKTGIQPILVTKKNTDRFRQQMKLLGLSFNWDREINTTDPSYYKWTQWIFIQLFKNGLAYKAETSVSWCPKCKIVLALEEVIDEKCERCGTVVENRRQKQWILRITTYADRLDKELDLVDFPTSVKLSQRNWIGRKEGSLIKFKVKNSKLEIKEVEVFTTRPDTIFGATFLALSPEHKITKLLASQNKDLAAYLNSLSKSANTSQGVNREKTGFETGLVAVNPLSQEELPVWVSDYVLGFAGTGALMGVPAHDQRDFEFAKAFSLPIKQVIEAQDIPYEGEGKLINSSELSNLSSSEAKEKIGRKTCVYHLRDWIFSRQHYWGEPIPMIYCQRCADKKITWWDTKEGKKFKSLFDPFAPEKFDNQKLPVELAGWFPITDDSLPLTLPQVEKYQPTDTGESPLANISSWTTAPCPECAKEAKRETDTMPNWAGSSWYYLRFADPQNNHALASRELMDYWQDVDVYCGGSEHTTLHLLYSRFWHKFLHDIGIAPFKEPYAKRRVHGMILAEGGVKMSKSKGNVINPDEEIQKHGSDILRMYLAFIGPYEQTLPWNNQGVLGIKRFLSRVWQIYHNKDKFFKESSNNLKQELAKTITRVTDGIDNLRQNVGIAALMEFVNAWEAQGALGFEEGKTFLKLLAPYAPHIAEELFQIHLASTSKGIASTSKYISVHNQTWPVANEADFEQEKITIAVQFNGKTRGLLEVLVTDTSERVEEIIQKEAKYEKYFAESVRRKVIFVPGKIINFIFS